MMFCNKLIYYLWILCFLKINNIQYAHPLECRECLFVHTLNTDNKQSSVQDKMSGVVFYMSVMKTGRRTFNWTANDHSWKKADIYIHDLRSLSVYFFVCLCVCLCVCSCSVHQSFDHTNLSNHIQDTFMYSVMAQKIFSL